MNELVSDRTCAEAHSKEQQICNAVASSDQCLDKDREISHDGIFEEDLMENMIIGDSNSSGSSDQEEGADDDKPLIFVSNQKVSNETEMIADDHLDELKSSKVSDVSNPDQEEGADDDDKLLIFLSNLKDSNKTERISDDHFDDIKSSKASDASNRDQEEDDDDDDMPLIFLSNQKVSNETEMIADDHLDDLKSSKASDVSNRDQEEGADNDDKPLIFVSNQKVNTETERVADDDLKSSKASDASYRDQEEDASDDDKPLIFLSNLKGSNKPERIVDVHVDHLKSSKASGVSNPVMRSKNTSSSIRLPSQAALRDRIFELEILPVLSKSGLLKLFQKYYFNKGQVDWIAYPYLGDDDNDPSYLSSMKLLVNYIESKECESNEIMQWVLNFRKICDDIIEDDNKSKYKEQHYIEDLDYNAILVITRAAKVLSPPDIMPQLASNEQEKKEMNDQVLKGLLKDQKGCHNEILSLVVAFKKVPRLIGSKPIFTDHNLKQIKSVLAHDTMMEKYSDFDLEIEQDPNDSFTSIIQIKGMEKVLDKVSSYIEKRINFAIEKHIIERINFSPKAIILDTKVKIEHDLDFDVGEGDKDSNGLLMYSLGKTFEKILDKNVLNAGVCLHTLNGVELKSTQDLNQYWKKAMNSKREEMVSLKLDKGVDISLINISEVTRIICSDGSVPGRQSNLPKGRISPKSERKMKKKEVDKLSLFRKKILPLYHIEFSRMNKNFVMKTMCDMHKKRYGITCRDDCTCFINLKELTRGLREEAQEKWFEGGQNGKNPIEDGCGFIDNFYPAVKKKIIQSKPNVQPFSIFKRAIRYWSEHVERVGSQCNSLCMCHEVFTFMNRKSTQLKQRGNLSESDSKFFDDSPQRNTKKRVADSSIDPIVKKKKKNSKNNEQQPSSNEKCFESVISSGALLSIPIAKKQKRTISDVSIEDRIPKKKKPFPKKVPHLVEASLIENVVEPSSIQSKSAEPQEDVNDLLSVPIAKKKIQSNNRKVVAASSLLKPESSSLTHYETVPKKSFSELIDQREINTMNSVFDATKSLLTTQIETRIDSIRAPPMKPSNLSIPITKHHQAVEFSVIFKQDPMGLGFYCYTDSSAGNNRCLIYSISPRFHKTFSSFQLRSGAQVKMVAEVDFSVEKNKKVINTHEDLRAYFERAKFHQKKIRIWFKNSNNGNNSKEETFQNDWTDKGEWIGISLKHGWAGGALSVTIPKVAKKPLQPTDQKLVSIKEKENLTGGGKSILKSTFKYSPTFNSGTKERHDMKVFVSWATIPIKSVHSFNIYHSADGKLTDDQALSGSDSLFTNIFNTIINGSVADLIESLEAGVNIRCKDERDRSPFKVISELQSKLKRSLAKLDSNKFAVERAETKLALKVLDDKKIVLKIYHCADKIIKASETPEEVKNTDTLKVRLKKALKITFLGEPNANEYPNTLFMIMHAWDKEFIETVTAIEPLQKNITWPDSDMRILSFDINTEFLKGKKFSIKFLKGSLTNNTLLADLSLNQANLIVSKDDQWSSEIFDLIPSASSELESAQVMVDFKKGKKIYDVQKSLRELIGWIDQYNGTCVNKSFILPMNLTHSLLRAAIYLSDEVSMQNILELELKMGIGKHHMESAEELIKSLIDRDKTDSKDITKLDEMAKILQAYSLKSKETDSQAETEALDTTKRGHLLKMIKDKGAGISIFSFGSKERKVICDNFGTEDGCKFGKKCRYYHIHVPIIPDEENGRIDILDVDDFGKTLVEAYKVLHKKRLDEQCYTFHNLKLDGDERIGSCKVFSVGFTCPLTGTLVLASSGQDLIGKVDEICWYSSEKAARHSINIAVKDYLSYECLKSELTRLYKTKSLSVLFDRFYPDHNVVCTCWKTPASSLKSKKSFVHAKFTCPIENIVYSSLSNSKDVHRDKLSAKKAAFKAYLYDLHKDGKLLQIVLRIFYRAEANGIMGKEKNLQKLYNLYFPTSQLKNSCWKIKDEFHGGKRRFKAFMSSPGEDNRKYPGNERSTHWFDCVSEAKKATFLVFLEHVLAKIRRV